MSENEKQKIQQERLPFKMFENKNVQTIYHVYISEQIKQPHYYIDLIQQLNSATKNDTFYFHLNTPGGRVDAGTQIVSAMKATEARVVTCAEGSVCSMGTGIFLAGDEFIVHDDCLFMFHNYSGGVSGKGHEQIARVQAEAKFMRNFSYRLYIPFFNEEEFEKLIAGQDFWMEAPEVRERLKSMIETMKEQEKNEDTDSDDETPKEVSVHKK